MRHRLHAVPERDSESGKFGTTALAGHRVPCRWLARLQATIRTGRRLTPPGGETVEKWGHTVKKLLILVLVAIGGLLIWRKVQADRAELDLWTEATSSDN